MNRAYGKIFIYELRRMAVSWLFLAMLIVNGAYAWYVLTSDILMGVADTAPFSVWSYCVYIGKMMPAAVAAVLLLLAGYYGRKQKQVEVLFQAAPVTAANQMMIRTAVLGVCFVMICVTDALAAAVFYICFFQYKNFVVFLVPSLFILIPCFLLGIGMGHVAGRLHTGAVDLVAAALFLAGFMLVTNAFDFYGAGYFSAYPLILEAGSNKEPGFVMEAAWILARIVYGFLGAGLIFVNAYSMKRKPTRA